MAEETLDLRHLPRTEAYELLDAHVEAVLEGVNDEIAEMSTLACLLHHAFGHLWTGFYRVAEPGRLLRVGPYQGTLGCLEIAFGRGVCGTAAATGRTVVVEDVNEFPGHIACDGRALSEIVVPVRDERGQLMAVLDVDSERRGTFGDVDREWLERLVSRFARPRHPHHSPGSPDSQGEVGGPAGAHAAAAPSVAPTSAAPTPA